MNCKPGDLAIITRGRRSGQIVHVLYLSQGKHTGPNGLVQDKSTLGEWMCESSGSDFLGRKMSGLLFKTRHSCIPDFALRPIRDPGTDARTETARELEAV